MFYILGFLWLIRITKAILFWLYLWQLKEYRVRRFFAHFQTTKGKQLLFNKIIFLKIIFLLVFFGLKSNIAIEPGFLDTIIDFILVSSVFILLAIYFFEAMKAIMDYFSGRLIKPIFTRKMQFLVFALLSFVIGFLVFVIFFFQIPLVALLIFDILMPIIVSFIVLAFQPIAIFLRNRIIKKATKKREKFKNLVVIGITGSYGKTTTKEFLYTILSEKFGEDKVLKTKENQNSEIGVSQCILNDLKSEHQIFVCEMGAYNRGEIKLLCEIAKPKIGILTGINQQHLAIFGSQENIIKTKYELIESLPENGTAIFNVNNKYCLELYKKTNINKKLYGQGVDSADLENIAGAVEAAKELGMSDEEIDRGKKKIKPLLKVKKGIKGINIIDSTYSANPDGVISDLKYLKTCETKKIIIMPCLIELGKATKQVHQEIGKKIGEVCDLAIITTKECYNNIKEAAIESGMPEENILFLESPKQIFEKINSFSEKGDIILLESRVPKKLIDLLSK